MRSPIPYFGSKQTLADRIIAEFPGHRHYVEPYAGSLAVLLAKPPAPMETINDLDQAVVTFWRVLRDRPEDLRAACELTPHSRVSSMSMPGYLAGYRRRMPPAAERLMSVSLECRPALEVIAAYGRHDDVLLYVDPPYLGSTRARRQYAVEMSSAAEHHELIEALQQCRAAVALSGYPSPLYDDALTGWRRVEFDAFTGQANTAGRRTEVLWVNRDAPPTTLFEVTA